MSATQSSPLRALAAPTRLVDEVVAHLRGYISENELQDGARLPSERSLAEVLGTSRATVAQALRVLAVMGLIEIRHGSGVYIRHDPGSMLGTTFDLMVDLDPASVGQLADFRYWIEKSLLDTDSLPRVDNQRLQEDFEALTLSKSRLEAWIEADADFHVTLVAATQNKYLHAAYEMAHRKVLSVSYSDWIEQGSVPSWLRGERWKSQVELHREILEAAAAGDVPSMGAALEAHQNELMDHLTH